MNPYIKHDSGNMYDVLIDYYKQVEEASSIKIDLEKYNFKDINKIVVTGLGGSAISGDIFYTLFYNQLSIPYMVNRNYNLPKFIDNNTLVVACSYSGNTEETLSAFNEAKEKGCEIVTISSGGKLKELSQNASNLNIAVKGGLQPRCAIGLMLTTLIKFFENAGFVKLEDNFYTNIIELLRRKANEYKKENSDPYDFAIKIMGKVPIIHSTELMQSLNVRFRSQLAENSKVLAFSGIIPELNHNEIIAWERYDEKKFPAILIQIIDENDHPRNKLRFDITKDILIESKVEIERIESELDKFYLRVFDLLYFIDWVSFYLAVLRNVDPTPIKNINALKEVLSKIN